MSDPAADLPADSYDYVIVGAGIYGLLLGYFLRQLQPTVRVLVMEDNTIPGEGITVNTGGIIRACYSNPGVMVAASFGRPYFADPTETMGLSTDVHTAFIPAGWGRFVNESASPGIRTELERIVASARELGIAGIWAADLTTYMAKLNADRRANLLKVFDVQDVTDVLVDDNGGYADGGTALLAFLEAALEYGVDIARLCSATGFVRKGGMVCGVRYRRWRTQRHENGDSSRETVREGHVTAGAVIVAAGAGSRKLIERECQLRMATFPTFHQTPLVENTSDVGLKRTQYPRKAGVAAVQQGHVVTADLPVISHWRDLYFHSEGTGVTVGAHHRELHDEAYRPSHGKLVLEDCVMEVGLTQVLVDKLVENMAHFPLLASDGLRLGKSPGDVPGGFYVMNPEELPFEGPVPGHDGLYYIGSGSGTGFKLGPGLACLLAQRLAGVPRDERLVAGDTLSVERNRYFFAADTSEAELRALFEPASGRFRHVGASGVRVHDPSDANIT